MIHSLKYNAFFFLLLVLLLSTCKKKEIYPSVPSFAYKGVSFYMANDGTDSLMVLSFTFKDGDGDIGLNQQDTNAPYQAARDKYNKPTNP